MIASIRLCEYQTRVVDWSHDTKQAVMQTAASWAEAHALPKPPLRFDGPTGAMLCAEHYVGVIEAGGVRVEIYPKLDKALFRDEALDDQHARSVMANLLWLLEVSGYGGLVDAGDASVSECPDAISDLLAWLFARRLRHQLALGTPHEYVGLRDDLPLVRGRIQFARQATVNFGRPDVIACAWDEFSADTALARLLRCATELLLQRVRLPGAAADLRDALAMFDEVPSVHPLQALSDAAHIRWSRLNARWRPCHDLALAILQGLGRTLHSGAAESFVYLLDMNALFESYCARWIESRFKTVVSEQVFVGKLLLRDRRSLNQYADFVWPQTDHTLCVGDAKYKQPNADEWPQIADTRQLICYGQLAAQRYQTKLGSLMMLYPTTGVEVRECVKTYDGQQMVLQAVRVVKDQFR
jgi:5-methylcytosine-specific restriction enzyme subunit McrC